MSDSEKPKSWKRRRQSIKHKWLVPFIFPEWLCERLSYFLGQWALLDILERLGHIAIVVAVIFYFAESGSRRKAKHYQAWQVINLAQGKTGSGGRKEALEDLHKDEISLVGVDVSQAYLPHLELPNADLTKANLSKANLFHATLTNAVIQDANLFKTYLDGADLRWAQLMRAQLIDATLNDTKLMKAKLNNADVSDANLISADLSGADLWRSNLRSIKNWRKIKSIEKANINDVNNPPDEFKEWAIKNGAVLIEDYGDWKQSLHEIRKRQEQTQQKQ